VMSTGGGVGSGGGFGGSGDVIGAIPLVPVLNTDNSIIPVIHSNSRSGVRSDQPMPIFMNYHTYGDVLYRDTYEDNRPRTERRAPAKKQYGTLRVLGAWILVVAALSCVRTPQPSPNLLHTHPHIARRQGVYHETHSYFSYSLPF